MWLEEDKWPPKMGRLEESEDQQILKALGGRGGLSWAKAAQNEPRPTSGRPTMQTTIDRQGRRIPHYTFSFQHTGVTRFSTTNADPSRFSADYQRYIERDAGQPTDILADKDGLLSFGSPDMGGSPETRALFWYAVERQERHPNARIQNRLIVELPIEVLRYPELARRILQRYGEERFGSRGLVWWCVVHRPHIASGSDPRNVHAHLTYHDRWAKKEGQKWRFGKRKLREVRGRKYPWGAECPSARIGRLDARRSKLQHGSRKRRTIDREREEVRKYLETPFSQIVGIGWIAASRRHYCETVNHELTRLSDSGVSIDRYFDHRSYAEAGIDKTATEHLGSRQTFLERRGYPSAGGHRNRMRELASHIIEDARHAAHEMAKVSRLCSNAFGFISFPWVKDREAGITLEITSNYWALRQEVLDAFTAAREQFERSVERLRQLNEDGPEHLAEADPQFWRDRQASTAARIHPTSPEARYPELIQAKIASVARLYGSLTRQVSALPRMQQQPQSVAPARIPTNPSRTELPPVEHPALTQPEQSTVATPRPTPNLLGGPAKPGGGGVVPTPAEVRKPPPQISSSPPAPLVVDGQNQQAVDAAVRKVANLESSSIGEVFSATSKEWLRLKKLHLRQVPTAAEVLRRRGCEVGLRILRKEATRRNLVLSSPTHVEAKRESVGR